MIARRLDFLGYTEMQWARLNVFQRLVRQWDQLHPYNAAQFMRLAGQPNPDGLNDTWRQTLSELGLGPLQTLGDRYRFDTLNGDAHRCRVESIATSPDRSVDANAVLEDYITAQLNRPFEAHDLPLRPFAVESDATSHVIGVVYHHWIADSASIRMLMREWFLRLHDPARARRSPLRVSNGYWRFFNPERANWRVGEGLLASLRWSSRMKRVRRIERADFDQYRARFSLHCLPDGQVERLVRSARRRDVTLNDLLLAAVAHVCHSFGIVRGTRKRQDLAIGCVTDLRSRRAGGSGGHDDLADVFGAFLGFTSVVCRPHDLIDFEKLIERVADQTRLHKRSGVPEASMMRMLAGVVAHRMLGNDKARQFYRKRVPMAGGLSNVNLNGTWVQEYSPNPILDYVRVSPCGPVMPIVVTPTTLGNRLNFGLTCRDSIVPAPMATQMSEAFISLLMRAAGASAGAAS